MGMPSEELVLDADIRNWVLLPIVGIMVMVTLLRTFLQKLLKGETKLDVKKAGLKCVVPWCCPLPTDCELHRTPCARRVLLPRATRATACRLGAVPHCAPPLSATANLDPCC